VDTLNELPSLYGKDLFGEVVVPEGRGTMADNLLVPPFSVLNAAEGFWQERKRLWVAYGLKSEIGRDKGLVYGSDLRANLTQKYTARDEGKDETLIASNEEGTSVFDPVLCELMYRWFSPFGGQVVDPFAGGSVRGVVAHILRRKYWGCDLAAKQIEANRQQAKDIFGDTGHLTWVNGDSMQMVDTAPMADFIFSCPPYGDLEVYSDNPADISNMEYQDFLINYWQIIGKACARLKDNRFACFVVANFRDKKGNYNNLVGDTVRAFQHAGLHFYNDANLVTPRGSLPVRAGRSFDVTRKLGKTHQNVLVFLKGDSRKAAEACGDPFDKRVQV
jgi:hypothetical protein|tara:strand:+ start:1135 stop:2130 length:996 start_codon:yes stop_codon:yes gene_type:complete